MTIDKGGGAGSQIVRLPGEVSLMSPVYAAGLGTAVTNPGGTLFTVIGALRGSPAQQLAGWSDMALTKQVTSTYLQK